MALELVQPGINPLGQFDGHDDIYLTVKGGEIGTIVGVAATEDKGAADVDDGYVNSSNQRPVVTTALTSGDRPLFLIDEGISGYGTLFGSVIGGLAGQIADGVGQYNGQVLGPHTAAASGKLTLWDKPGLYAVTLDAVDTTEGTGLIPGSVPVAAALYATSAGLLTPTSASAFEAVVLGRFINFEPYKGGSLVTTPVSLVSAANSSGQASGMHRAVFTFNPPV